MVDKHSDAKPEGGTEYRLGEALSRAFSQLAWKVQAAYEFAAHIHRNFNLYHDEPHPRIAACGP